MILLGCSPRELKINSTLTEEGYADINIVLNTRQFTRV